MRYLILDPQGCGFTGEDPTCRNHRVSFHVCPSQSSSFQGVDLQHLWSQFGVPRKSEQVLILQHLAARD